MKKNFPWVLGFVGLYGLHAAFYLSFKGALALPLPDLITRGGSVATLVGLTVLVAAFVASRDEVLRKIAFQAGAAAALVSGFFSYGLQAFDATAPLISSDLWAFTMLVFLFVYGALSWRATS